MAIQQAALREKEREEELMRKRELALKVAEEQKKLEQELQIKREQEAFERLPQVFVEYFFMLTNIGLLSGRKTRY